LQKDKFNNNSITSRNIRVNKVNYYRNLKKEENNIMEDNNIESWIIDSGTGINLSKNIKNTIKH